MTTHFLYLFSFFVILWIIHGKSLKDLSYEDIEAAAIDVQGVFAKVKSARELYGLPSARNKVFKNELE
jgi:hypothetical protein